MSRSQQQDDINRANLPNDMLSLMQNQESQNIPNSNQSDFFPLILNESDVKF